MILGATPAGIAAANKLGELGVPVALVDGEPDLNEKFYRDEWRLASGVRFNFAHRPGLIRILRNPGIRLFMPATVNSIKHSTQGFTVRITPQQTFVDPEKCTLCGRCLEACPVNLPDGKKAIRIASRRSIPGRARIEKAKTPPCQERCPLGVNAQGYIALVQAGKYAEALEMIRRENVLPGICGRICTHPCEAACRRSDIDAPVAIRTLKRFVTDSAAVTNGAAADRPAPVTSPKTEVAVVGSGPAGLAAAAELARNGCEVTVYEKETLAGGLLRYGIGRYRLPDDILDQDLRYIQDLGVQLVTGHPVDLSLGLDGLLKKFAFLVLATGSWLDRKLGVPGEDLQGVDGCLAALNRLYRGEISEVQGRVAVIGDGNSAFDLARALVRLGAAVTVLSWFARDAIPADPEEVSDAIAEGVTIRDKLRVVAFKGGGSALEQICCVPTIPGPPDANGIAWPVTDPAGTQQVLSFDRAYVAIGQAGPLTPTAGAGLQVNRQGYLVIDERMKTGLNRIMAGGDAVTGPTSVVEAMASGRNAARSILQTVFKKDFLPPPPQRPDERDYQPIPAAAPRLTREEMAVLHPEARRTTFREVAQGLSADQAAREAERCLQCGICSQCLQCAAACSQIGAITHDEPAREVVENAGVVIIADPAAGHRISGEDVIRAYDTKSAGSDTLSLVVRGFAAASRAMMILGGSPQRSKGHSVSFSPPGPALSSDMRIGVFACRCNDALGWLEEMTASINELPRREGIVHAESVTAACIDEGAAAILRSIREKGITRVVLASCACCSLNFVCSSCTDQRSRLKAALFTGTGVSRSMVEMCNLRGEVLRLARMHPERALARFRELIDSSIERALMLKPLPSPARNYNFTTAVIGSSEAAAHSAQVLAQMGYEVFWFNRAEDGDAAGHPGIHCFSAARVTGVRGMLGDFQVLFQDGAGADQFIQAGAVIMSAKAAEEIKHIYQAELPGRDIISSMQQAGRVGVPFMYPGTTSVSGLYIADPAGIRVSDRERGAAAAALAAASMPQGPRSSRGFTVVVDESICRGCGRCSRYCPYQAISYKQNGVGGWVASVDDALCKGCGNCISVCPSNAADSPFRNHAFLERVLEEALLPSEAGSNP